MNGRRTDFWCALSLAAIATLLFADVLFLGNNFWFRDLFTYHFPLKRVVHDTIARGEFPWWNPFIGGGQPMAANPAYEIFYPPQWLILIGSFPFGFALHIVIHVYVALLGMYAFLRAVPLRVEAAMFGAISFGLGGFLLGTVTNLPTFFVWSWAGVVGWALLRLVRKGQIAPAALALAMPMLVLEPMALAQMMALVIAGVAWMDRRALPRAAGAMALAAALAAVQIVPAIDHTRDSSRARGFLYDVVVDYSMPPLRPLELIAPRAFGVVHPDAHAWWGSQLFQPRGTPYLVCIYCGVAVAILALAGMITRQRGTALVVAVCAVSYVLAIGGHTPLFRLLYAAGLRSIRYPEKFAAAGLITLIVFAAVVADRLIEVRRVAIIIAVLIAFVLAIAAIITTPSSFLRLWRLPPYNASLAAIEQSTLFMAAGVAAGWAIVLWRAGTSRLWNLAALALLVVDLGSLANDALPRMPRSFFTPPPIVARFDADRDAYAVFHRGEWTQRELADRLEVAAPAEFTRHGLRPFSMNSWGLRGALEADFDETELLVTHDLLDRMRAAGNGGTEHWSDLYVSISNVRYVLDYRPSLQHPVVATRLPNRGRFSFPTEGARVLRVAETSSTADIDVEAASPSLLVITITRHKYWQAQIDGRAAALQPANIAYQALAIPAGRHHVALRYRNPMIGWGAAVSGAAALALIVLRRRRPRPRIES